MTTPTTLWHHQPCHTVFPYWKSLEESRREQHLTVLPPWQDLLWAGGISGCFQWDFSRYFILHSGGKESAGDWSLSHLPIPISSNNFQWTCMVVINIIFSSPLGILFKSPVCFFPIVVWDMLRMNYSLFWPIFSFNYFSFASALPKILLLWMWCRNVLLLQKSLCMLTISNRKTCRCRI